MRSSCSADQGRQPAEEAPDVQGIGEGKGQRFVQAEGGGWGKGWAGGMLDDHEWRLGERGWAQTLERGRALNATLGGVDLTLWATEGC